jgi:hypothetical protein
MPKTPIETGPITFRYPPMLGGGGTTSLNNPEGRGRRLPRRILLEILFCCGCKQGYAIIKLVDY